MGEKVNPQDGRGSTIGTPPIRLDHETRVGPSRFSFRIASSRFLPVRWPARVTILLLAAALLGAGGLAYKRSDWPHWRDLDRDGQDTREEVLERDRECWGEECGWRDGYSSGTYLDPRQLDIDHLIPLERAWETGGWRWDRAHRTAYANWEPGLVVASAKQNRSKGSKGPAEWMPQAGGTLTGCDYVIRYVEVARHWGLFISVEEAELWAACKDAAPAGR